MINKISLLLAIFFITTQVSANTKWCDQFDDDQKDVLAHSYAYGLPYDLGYTLAAIAVNESSAGRFVLNYTDPSAGIYHNYAKTVLDREGIKNTHFNRNEILVKLINDEVYSTANALAELLYWVDNRSTWWSVWASYNAGKYYKSKDPQKYAGYIKTNINNLKKCEFLKEPKRPLDLDVFFEVKRLTGVDPKVDPIKAWKDLKLPSKVVSFKQSEIYDKL